jgi:hypothetical protein
MSSAEILNEVKVIPDLKTAQWTFADADGKEFFFGHGKRHARSKDRLD